MREHTSFLFVQISLCIGAYGKTFAADGHFIAVQLLHILPHGFVAGENIGNFFPCHARFPEGVFQAFCRAGIYAFCAAAASAFGDGFVCGQGSIRQHHTHTEGAAEFLRHKDTAFADPS